MDSHQYLVSRLPETEVSALLRVWPSESHATVPAVVPHPVAVAFFRLPRAVEAGDRAPGRQTRSCPSGVSRPRGVREAARSSTGTASPCRAGSCAPADRVVTLLLQGVSGRNWRGDGIHHGRCWGKRKGPRDLSVRSLGGQSVDVLRDGAVWWETAGQCTFYSSLVDSLWSN